MKTNTNKGFTLIELIMVIVILGILSAVAVPKFFSLTTQAHTKHKEAVLGTLTSSLNLYAANHLVGALGERRFPLSTVPLDKKGKLLDEVPDGWVYTKAATADVVGTWTYSGDASTITYLTTGATDSSGYTLTKSW